MSAPREVGPADPLPWVRVADGAPYFITEDGAPWHPIGHNDAISWPDLDGLYARRDLAAVEARFAAWVASGVTAVRLMLECAHGRSRYLERPAGRFVPAMVRAWDDLFAICERVGLRVMLTPMDTFWMWNRWAHHPWNSALGGPLNHKGRSLLDPGLLAALKARLEFAVTRWGGSGALWAWDLWNEMHPANGGGSAERMGPVIAELSDHVRELEQRLYGRSHPQTVSIFGPVLGEYPDQDIAGPIFRHPSLDFASIHIYRKGSIDHPRNTVAPAVAMGAIVADCLAEIGDDRPFLDTEHGPIHSFNDRRVILPEPFDDEMFRHTAWAHLASGGAGGGMRWPYRHPHRLTDGMRAAQKAMADILPAIDWSRFARTNWADRATATGFHVFACGDDEQAVVWLLRRDNGGEDGRMRRDTEPRPARLRLRRAAGTRHTVGEWDTVAGRRLRESAVEAADDQLTLDLLPVQADRAVTIRRI